MADATHSYARVDEQPVFLNTGTGDELPANAPFGKNFLSKLRESVVKQASHPVNVFIALVTAHTNVKLAEHSNSVAVAVRPASYAIDQSRAPASAAANASAPAGARTSPTANRDALRAIVLDNIYGSNLPAAPSDPSSTAALSAIYRNLEGKTMPSGVTLQPLLGAEGTPVDGLLLMFLRQMQDYATRYTAAEGIPKQAFLSTMQYGKVFDKLAEDQRTPLLKEWVRLYHQVVDDAGVPAAAPDPTLVSRMNPHSSEAAGLTQPLPVPITADALAQWLVRNRATISHGDLAMIEVLQKQQTHTIDVETLVSASTMGIVLFQPAMEAGMENAYASVKAIFLRRGDDASVHAMLPSTFIMEERLRLPYAKLVAYYMNYNSIRGRTVYNSETDVRRAQDNLACALEVFETVSYEGDEWKLDETAILRTVGYEQKPKKRSRYEALRSM